MLLALRRSITPPGWLHLTLSEGYGMRRLKIASAILTIALIFIISPSSGGQNKRASRHVVSFDGFGPVKVGMTVAAASKALGIPLVRKYEMEGDCYYVSPKRGFKDVSFMVTGRRISRVDIDAKGYATDRGAGVGDTEARIMRLYRGRVEVRGHPYVDGHYLRVNMKGGKFSIIFETDGKRVTSFRAGKAEEVGWIEGCS